MIEILELFDANLVKHVEFLLCGKWRITFFLSSTIVDIIEVVKKVKDHANVVDAYINLDLQLIIESIN